MNVTATKEQIDRLYSSQSVVMERTVMEKIERVSKAGEIMFRSVQVESIVPVGIGSSV